MKALQKTLIALGIILVFLMGISFLLPSKWHIEKSIIINAPIVKIDPYIRDLKKWPEWTPWNSKTDPGLNYTYEGENSGEGAISKWNSSKMGSGVLTITKADATRGIWYTINLNNGKMPSEGSIIYETINKKTKVIWLDSGELGNNPINRFLGLLITPILKVDFEMSLSQLKQLVENKK